MKHLMATAALLALLSGCNGTSPFVEDDTAVPTDPTDPTTPVPPVGPPVDDALDTGTVRPNPTGPEPEADDSILRLEARNEDFGGRVASVAYQPATDSFIVDGLGFDGGNSYARGTAVGRFGDYNVFEADVLDTDFLTGDPVGQIIPYRAIYGVSDNTVAGGDPRTAFAIVRTGGYAGYGFGGFLYERNGSVTLQPSAPDAGQAIFTGDYAGIRVFDGRGGLEYTTGDMEVAIDFRDFNANDAVQGTLSNRAAFNVDGSPVALGLPGLDDEALVLPTLTFVIQEGALNLRPNGELSGNVTSTRLLENGTSEIYEEGVYYGVIAGDMTSGDGGELVGILVFESTDPRDTTVTAQETGGFILYRGTDN